jgi:hypothetical protein
LVSWAYAFRRGLSILLWTIVWGIVGGIIAFIISGGTLFVFFVNPAESPLGAATVVFAAIIIGTLIASIGNYAAIVKIVLESVEEQKSP